MKYFRILIKNKYFNYGFMPLLIILFSILVANKYPYNTLLRYQILNIFQLILIVPVVINVFYIYNKHRISNKLFFIYGSFFFLVLNEVFWSLAITPNHSFNKFLFLVAISDSLMYLSFIIFLLQIILERKQNRQVILKPMLISIVLLCSLQLTLSWSSLADIMAYLVMIPIIYMETVLFCSIYSKALWLKEFLIGLGLHVINMLLVLNRVYFLPRDQEFLFANIATIIALYFTFKATITLKNTKYLNYPLNLDKNFYNTLMNKIHVMVIIILTLFFYYIHSTNFILMSSSWGYYFLLIFVLSNIALVFTRYISNEINFEIRTLVEYFSSRKKTDVNFKISEFKTLKTSLTKILNEIENSHKDNIRLENNKFLLEQNEQKNSEFRDKLALLVHDLKSPTLTISNVTNHIKQINTFDNTDLEALSIANTKINIMVQQLLKEYKSISTSSVKVFFHVFLLLHKIYKESQIIYRQIKFHFNTTQNSYSSCLYHNNDTLERVITNIIKNAAESIPNNKVGVINISMLLIDNVIRISISDNGIGMSNLVKNNILNGYLNVSTKTDGSGSGSRQIYLGIKELNGVYEIDSTLNTGTTITISIPTIPSPTWIINKINLDGINKIIILDDDKIILDIWQAKLSESNCFLNISFFETLPELESYLKNIPSHKDILFLCDYQIKTQNGVDVIKHLNIKNSILVTNLSESQELQETVEKNQINLLNKEFIPYLDITSNKNPAVASIKSHDMIWLDDQITFPRYIVNTYYKNINVKIFSAVDEFMTNIELYDRNITIVLDHELSSSSNMKRTNGTEIATILHTMGFLKIIILSATKLDQLPDYIKSFTKDDFDSLLNLHNCWN